MIYLLSDCVGGKFSGPVFPHSIYQGLPCDPSTGTIVPSSLNDILVVAANVIQLLLSLAGVIAAIMIIIGAIMFVISAGDPGRVKKAKDILTNSIVGLVITIAAYAIVSFVSGVF